MNTSDTTSLADTVRAALFAVAPDLADQPLDPARRYRDQFEFDSMDFNRYLVELHRRTGIDVPPQDYRQLESLTDAVAWLAARQADGG